VAQSLFWKGLSRSLNHRGRRNTRVLIVDDNSLLASLIQVMLEDEGYETMSAGDGREGYLRYLFFMPEVVITDLQMPVTNGLELMKQIRRHNPRVKTIYMSGDLCPFGPLLKEEMTNYPVSILEKPFSMAELLDLLSGCVDGQRGRDSLDTFDVHGFAG
jgi:CheY-like chemotaxis protein